MKLMEDGFVERNKKVILIATLIMLVSAIAGAGISYINADGEYNVISNALSSHKSNVTGDFVGTGSVELFVHNIIADFITILGGLFFSILSVISVIYNGLSVGTVFGIDLPYAAVSVLPHAIIEYFAGALALAIAFKITKLEIKIIKNRNLRNTLKEHEIDLKDMLTIFIVMVILLGIAAIIEGHITPMITLWYFGL